ncbi:RHS repeat-associated core domain-containing protein [Streptomyces sp. NPDC051662]|uniref:RHS repeat-associated core domain-containing protein n=1 Tax=Streptomyces sp. NPDC051662 TaxID=3154750 RepID=UPI00343DF140
MVVLPRRKGQATDSTPKVTSYTYTDRGQKLKETKANDNTYHLDGALKSTTEKKADGTTLVASHTYTYDPFGRQQSVISGGKVIERSVYDGFDHVVESQKTDAGAMKSTKYTFDPLDRTASKTADGKATYGYTAYGNNDATEFTGIDRPEAGRPDKETYNPYRFNAKRWDAQSGTYDMGFRDYSPGLNRFTTRDMYNGALSDMNLGADPYTSNRYAFTGGNPVSNVEIDGHWFALPALVYWAAGALGLGLAASTPQGQQSLQDAGQAIGDMLRPSADEAGSSDSSSEPRPGPTPQPSPGSAPRPAPRGTDNNTVTCNPMPLIDGGRIYGGLEEYTNHQGNKGCRATGAFAYLTKSDRRSRTGANGLPKCPECEPSVSPDGMGEIEAGGGKPQAGHLIGYWGKSTGQDVRNLVALHGSANRRMASKVERFGWKHLTGGNKLSISVVPI